MELNNENYYSKEANQQYMSVSQYKSFLQCEAAALAELKGEHVREEKETFLVGQYVHSWAQGPEYLDEFICNHPEIISSRGATKGELKAPYKVAEAMINTLKYDPKAMFYLNGKKEVPVNALIAGVPWKGKIDVLNDDLNYILDIKTSKNIAEFSWSSKLHQRVSFIEEYDYMIQAAVYSEMERIAAGRDTYKDFYMVAVTKQDPPDHQIFDLTDPDRIQEELQKIKENLPRILQVKHGEIEPARCGCCAYCRATKKVDKIIHYTELREAF